MSRQHLAQSLYGCLMIEYAASNTSIMRVGPDHRKLRPVEIHLNDRKLSPPNRATSPAEVRPCRRPKEHRARPSQPIKIQAMDREALPLVMPLNAIFNWVRVRFGKTGQWIMTGKRKACRLASCRTSSWVATHCWSGPKTTNSARPCPTMSVC